MKYCDLYNVCEQSDKNVKSCMECRLYNKKLKRTFERIAENDYIVRFYDTTELQACSIHTQIYEKLYKGYTREELEAML